MQSPRPPGLGLDTEGTARGGHGETLGPGATLTNEVGQVTSIKTNISVSVSRVPAQNLTKV